MVNQRETIEIIGRTLKESPKIPDQMSYLLREADPEGADANVSVPLIEIQNIDTTRDDPTNSNFVDYLTNDAGEQVGYVYQTTWEMSLEIDIWTADGSDNDVDEFAAQMREVLYAYDTRGHDKQFRDENGEPVSDIWGFALQDGQRNDSLVETPSVRRWRQNARVRGAEVFTSTTENPPVRNVTQQ